MSTQPDASHNFSERFLARKIIVAKIGRPHGVRGWVSLISYTDPADNVVEFDQYWLGEADAWTQIDPPKFSFKGDKLLIKMPDVDTPEIVRERLLHQLIAVERRQLPLPEEGAYYWSDLEGLTVVNQDGVEFGQIDYLYPTGANDIIVVKTPDGESLLPYIDEVVLSIDLNAQVMKVAWNTDDL